jgi:hypothetical protein
MGRTEPLLKWEVGMEKNGEVGMRKAEMRMQNVE